MTSKPKKKTVKISSDLLGPVVTALGGVLATWMISKHWGVTQTALVAQALFTFGAGYLIAPDQPLGVVGRLFDALNLSRKLVAAVVVAVGTAVVTWIVTGAWDETQLTTGLTALLGLLAATVEPADRTKPAD